MINLMAPVEQRQLAAARTNTLLLRYTILLIVFVVALALEILALYIVIDIGRNQNQATIAENNAKAKDYAIVKKQATDFRNNLATAKYILDKQVPYTTLILALAHSLPDGAVINKLDLDPTTFGTPTTITVNTTSYNKAIAVKAALQQAKVDGVPLFTSVSFQSVSSNVNGSSTSYTANYDITYSKKVLAQ